MIEIVVAITSMVTILWGAHRLSQCRVRVMRAPDPFAAGPKPRWPTTPQATPVADEPSPRFKEVTAAELGVRWPIDRPDWREFDVPTYLRRDFEVIESPEERAA